MPETRPLLPFMRFILYVASFLVFVAGFQLFVLSEQTETFFSWTIKPFITAVFLGGGYWASGLLEFLAARQTTWNRARVAVFPVFVFTLLTLIATLLHIDKFHFASTNFITLGATWLWLAIYALVPLLIIIALVWQYRLPGSDDAPDAPLPSWLRILVALQTAFTLVVGVLFFLVPFFIGDAQNTAVFLSSVWPWTLSALTGRAVGAWLIGLGLTTGMVAVDNNLHLSKIAFPSLALFAILQFIGILRYGDQVVWTTTSSWVYVAFLLSILFVGVYGIMVTRGFPPARE